jgi:hypothetical protein
MLTHQLRALRILVVELQMHGVRERRVFIHPRVHCDHKGGSQCSIVAALHRAISIELQLIRQRSAICII